MHAADTNILGDHCGNHICFFKQIILLFSVNSWQKQQLSAYIDYISLTLNIVSHILKEDTCPNGKN